MRWRRVPSMLLLVVIGILGIRLALTPAQNGGSPAVSPQVVATSPQIIKTESNLVVLDVIATDKKGNYIKDLQVKEFQVFEDNKLQVITSFSPAGEPQGPNGPSQPRYIVLFFDDSTIPSADQMAARRAANQFIEKTASPNRLMAVVDFGGTTQVVQNFTADSEKLKRAAANVRFSAVSPNIPAQTVDVASLGAPTADLIRSDYGARTMLLAIRNLAKSLAVVPGRKTLILFSEGFALTAQNQSELDATIDAANKANVAIYPVDVGGLQAAPPSQIMRPSGALLLDSPFPHQTGLLACLLGMPDPSPQRGGGGGGMGGGSVGGGSAGGVGGPSGGHTGSGVGSGTTGSSSGSAGGHGSTSTSTSTSTSGSGTRGGAGTTSNTQGSPYSNYINSQCNDPTLSMSNTSCPQSRLRNLYDPGTSARQQVLQALAAGTGGFTIFNTNDFLAGLNRISGELDQYYILGYVPADHEHDGSYHKIQVKVTRAGVQLRHRNGYYDLKSPDLLAGKPEGKSLEDVAASSQPGEVPVSLSTPYFFTSPGVARVNISLQIPASAINFEKDKKEAHSKVLVLGIAYREDGSVAARFSDSVKLDMEKKQLKDFSKRTFDYRNIFNIASGKYTLKLVLSAGGDKYAKYQAPLTVAPFDGQHFEISGPALSNDVRPVNQMIASLDSQLLADQTPLIYRNMEIFPTPGNRFERGDKIGFYVEVFEPRMQSDLAPRVGVFFAIVDRKTNQQVYASNTIPVDVPAQTGTPLLPLAQGIPADLQAGEYRLEVWARNSEGGVTSKRTADFVLE
jgi:VWFA-related protein